MDHYEYKDSNFPFSSIVLVSCHIMHFWSLFGGDLRVEMTPTPFELLRSLFGPFGLGKVVSCACSLSHARCVDILGHFGV